MGILVLFHIQVDELGLRHTIHISIWIVDGRLIELGHAAHQFREALLIVQGVRLRIDTGNLDGDIVDVWFLQGLQIRIVALVGLAVAQHHFTQQVDVLTDVLLESCGQMLCQAGTCGIDDDTTGVPAQAPLDDGHCCPIEEGQVGKLLVHPEECMVGAVQELGDAVLVDKFLHAQGQLLAVAYLAGLVEHAHDEFLVAGRSHHRAIHVLFTLLRLGKAGITLVVEFAHPGEDFLDSW